jgi:Cys-tRNA(Pro)/Cys-tRNA(Cys) deacylase
MAKRAKTNAARLLDGAAIAYEIRTYDLPMDEFSAEAVADAIDMPADAVFKSLVVDVEGVGPCFAVVRGDADLDLKAIARAAGGRKAHLAPLKDVHRLTGYVRGAVTVLGAKKAFPVYIDDHVTALDTMAVSAGARGLQLVVAATDYLSATEGTVASIARAR